MREDGSSDFSNLRAASIRHYLRIGGRRLATPPQQVHTGASGRGPISPNGPIRTSSRSFGVTMRARRTGRNTKEQPPAWPPARVGAISLGLFFVLVFILTWIVWVPRALASQGMIDSNLAVLLGRGWTYAPAIAAVLFLGLVGGRSAVADLGRRLIAWRIGWRWYTVIVAIPLGIALVAAAIYGILGGQFSAALPVSFELPIPLALLVIVIRTLTDGLGEETAWRGVALPGLLTRMNAVTASLVLGVIWAAWHLPLFFTKGSVMANDSILLLFVLLPAESVVYTWVYQYTRGSVLAAALFHGLIGFFS